MVMRLLSRSSINSTMGSVLIAINRANAKTRMAYNMHVSLLLMITKPHHQHNSILASVSADAEWPESARDQSTHQHREHNEAVPMEHRVQPENAAAANDADNVLQMQCPPHLIGLVIGRKGETILRIQDVTGTMIHVQRHGPPDVMRNLTIRGIKDGGSVKKAADMLEKLIWDASAPACSDRGPNTHTSNRSMDTPSVIRSMDKTEYVTECIDCPVGVVGSLIGRNGETIRMIQAETNTLVTVHRKDARGRPLLPLKFYRDVFTTQQSLERQLARAKQHVALMQQANVALSEAICGPLGIMSLLPPPLDPRRLNASVLQFLFTAARCLRTNAPIDRYAALHHIEADVFEDAASEFNYPKLLLSSQQSTTTQQAAATNATVLATDDCAMACGTDGHGEMLPHDDIMSPVSESPLSVSEAEEGEIFNDDNAADDFMD
eukprot:gene6632-7941_t